ncbi:biosynthetic arginine decarboxylase [Reinekea marina]|uniref:Arginine decarboxylase n=1 Tax=Reinekea marina TaxID=1310421 RepID=A0ABV7WRG0_9GAMM|nr:biosynthetic arginine decarboxylase [Reinekea marina]MDN3650936.1 biosynthetic arginine decarboxylase [Reinekea marina]
MGKNPSFLTKPNSVESATPWTTEDSAQLYGVNDWGADYFSVNEAGQAVVNVPFGEQKASVAILDIIQAMSERGLEMPAMLRIENLLDDRIAKLNNAFAEAITAYDYQNVYRGVFPIKVNQQCHVVEEIADYGRRFSHGLEAGSKAELIIALAKLQDNDSLIVCNGYKDSEFIELGLYAREMGIPCFFILETPAELPIIIKASQRLGIKPLLGVRIRSSVKVDGHWNADSGDRSIFGLSTTALFDVVTQLKAADMIDCLQLLHCHIGSQIPNIRNIRNGVQEACQFYSGLQAEGAPMGYLDLGGGLAVDYEGTRNISSNSMNYGLDEYCAAIVETISEALTPKGIAHPVIVTESGRATVAYSSMLLFNILDVRNHDPAPLPDALPEDSHELLQNLWLVNDAINSQNYQECFHDAEYYRDQIRQLFLHGQIGLSERACADNLALAVFEKVAKEVAQQNRPAPELLDIHEQLADVYYGNFSLFQSLPDAWAIDQVFPVMPVHRLEERPTRHAVIADITCDCDGQINRFASVDGIKKTIRLHEKQEQEDYYLGVFLVGAYQETLGDLHNLFGDTNVVSVHISEDGSLNFAREFHGDSISDVLSYVEYDPKIMQEEFRKRAEAAVKQGKITAVKRKTILKAFKDSLDGYTYFESETL